MAERILMMTANPKDTARLRLETEARAMRESFRRSGLRDEFDIFHAPSVRGMPDLRRAMLDYNPTIVHFSGHGSGAAGISFEDAVGLTHEVSTEALASFFTLFADTVKCVVLNACSTQEQAEALGEHIHYVIGMKDVVGDSAAQEFSLAFYDALGAGRPIPFAFEIACNAIQIAGLPGHDVPVLVHSGVLDTPAERLSGLKPAPADAEGASASFISQPGHLMTGELVDFLCSLPSIQSRAARDTLLISAGLDPALRNSLSSDLPVGQFFAQVLDEAVKYGQLQDGRDALDAVMEAAYRLVGDNRQKEGKRLLQSFRAAVREEPQHVKQAPDLQLKSSQNHIGFFKQEQIHRLQARYEQLKKAHTLVSKNIEAREEDYHNQFMEDAKLLIKRKLDKDYAERDKIEQEMQDIAHKLETL